MALASQRLIVRIHRSGDTGWLCLAVLRPLTARKAAFQRRWCSMKPTAFSFCPAIRAVGPALAPARVFLVVFRSRSAGRVI